MGQVEEISLELINELLIDIFPKENNLDKILAPDQRSKLEHQDNKFIPNSAFIPFRPSTSAFSVNKTYNTRKIRNTGNCCHFCGETGHIKQTCFKKQAYDNTRKIPTVSAPPSISYDLDFLKSVSKLTQVKNCEIPIEELIRIRRIINTLIYFHPSQNNHP